MIVNKPLQLLFASDATGCNNLSLLEDKKEAGPLFMCSIPALQVELRQEVAASLCLPSTLTKRWRGMAADWKLWPWPTSAVSSEWLTDTWLHWFIQPEVEAAHQLLIRKLMLFFFFSMELPGNSGFKAPLKRQWSESISILNGRLHSFPAVWEGSKVNPQKSKEKYLLL